MRWHCSHWIFHRPTLTTRLLRIGFVDALKDGGDAFLRWDFWNSVHAKVMRKYRLTPSFGIAPDEPAG